MINVLIVEDSRVVSEYLYYILSRDPEIQVIGNVSNGLKAIEFIREHKPDVVSMDIEMPIMNGLEATRIIMSTTPVPILIVTASRNANEVAVTMDALAAGALAVIEKPVGVGHPNEQKLSGELVTMIKLMAEVKVICRRPKRKVPPAAISESTTAGRVPLSRQDSVKIIAIGVSSGGPQTLAQIFSGISGRFPAPILVVQHITEGFLKGLVDWLAKTTEIPIRIAGKGEKIIPGQVYFAPDHFQMGLSSPSLISLTGCDRGNRICPSAAHLFSSVARTYGKQAMGILLTGMGRDGASELRELRELGAITIAQDKESSLIHGMPGAAISLDAASHVLSADQIGDLLWEIESGHSRGKIRKTP